MVRRRESRDGQPHFARHSVEHREQEQEQQQQHQDEEKGEKEPQRMSFSLGAHWHTVWTYSFSIWTKCHLTDCACSSSSWLLLLLNHYA